MNGHDSDPSEEPTQTAFPEPPAASKPSVDRSGLAGFEPFVGLEPALRRQLEALVRPQSFAAGEYLMRQGDPGDSLMLVVAGEVDIVVDDGVKQHLLRRGGPGEVLGEMALLTGGPRTASVVAVSQLRALVLDANDFHRLAQEEPSLSMVLTRLVASRLGQATHDALAGKNLGGFAIRRRLGSGGMALVYEAEESATGRRVALKMMSHRLVYNRLAEERFQREANVVESFDHPNLVRMYGRFAAFHTYFMVMEFCDGMSLGEILADRGRLSETEVRAILGQLALALGHAHRADVVHRDVKPSNVLVSRDGVVKLMDFGLARHSRDPAEPRGLWGTPVYMSPEQLRCELAGPETDVFSLGLLAFEMLAGQRVFKSDSVDGLLKEHAALKIPDLAVTCPGVSTELRDMITNWLSAAPAARHLDVEVVGRWAHPLDYGTLVGARTDGDASESATAQ